LLSAAEVVVAASTDASMWRENGDCIYNHHTYYIGSGDTIALFGLIGPGTSADILNTFIHIGLRR
jgi:hypothetical protein